MVIGNNLVIFEEQILENLNSHQIRNYFIGFILSKWAIPAADIFDLDTILKDFLKYCNVVSIPAIQKNLF